MPRGYRRRRSWGGKGRTRKYGFKPTPQRLHKEMNSIPKQKRKKEAWLQEYGRRFDFVMVPLPRLHGTKDPSAYYPALKRALNREAFFDSLGHIPVTPKTVVFLVHRKSRDPLVWSAPELRVQSRQVAGDVQWRRVRRA